MSLFRSTAIVSFLTLFSRILGLVRDMVLMNIFGANALMDAFLVAFKIPNLFRRLFTEGAFSQAFVPILTEYQVNHHKNTVKLLIAEMSGIFGLILLVLTVLVLWLSPAVVQLFAWGFDKQTSAIASDLLKITFPYLFFIAMTAFFGSILQSYQRFVTPAFAPVLLNICMIIGALFFANQFNIPIMAVAWAVLLAGMLQMAIQLPDLYRLGLLVLPKFSLKNQGVKQILRLMLPAIFAVSVTQINLLLNTVFASLMTKGSISWLYTAERLSELPLGLIGIAIGTVILPNLSNSIASNNPEIFKKTLDWAVRLILLAGIPASVALWLLADTLMLVLFQRGEFRPADALMSGFALECLAGGVFGFMLIKVLAPAFFARKDSQTPVKIGIISVMANVALSGVFVAIFYAVKLPLHGGLALATTGASFINAGLLYYQLYRQKIWQMDKNWTKLFGQIGVATALMSAMLLAILPYFPYQSNTLQQLLALVGICLLGVLVYGVGLFLFGLRLNHLKHH